MKKYIVTFSIIAVSLITTQVKAQQEETYEKANTLIENLLKDPDISASDRETLKEAIKQNNEAIKALKSPDTPVYSTDAPKNNTANYDHAPAAVKPKPTPVINGNSNRGNGRTMVSGNAN